MIATPAEMIELGIWEMYCVDNGVNPHSVSEGQIEADTQLEWKL